MSQTTFTLQMPPGTGRAALLKSLGELLRNPRVREVTLSATEGVSYTVTNKEDAPFLPVSIDFAELDPYQVVRTRKLVELQYHPSASDSAGDAFVWMLQSVARANLLPLGILVHPRSWFWEWLGVTPPKPEELQYVGACKLYESVEVPEDVLLILGCNEADELYETLNTTFRVTLPRRSNV